ncbi:MAG: NEL-type E3 ubiquitin ligase domain-containing protein, partial [Pseudomonas sp.]
PEWLTRARAEHLQGYQDAVQAQQASVERLRHLLDGIPSIEAYAAPLLGKALSEVGLHQLDPRHAYVVIKEEFKFPSAAEKFYKPSVTYHSRHSLLAAAMHNFHEQETRPWSLRQAHLEGPQGVRLPLQFERFASLCRSLDIGAGYQALLNKVLLPKSGRGQPEGQARRAVEQLFEGCLQSRMQASVYEARFKGEIDESDLQRLLAWFNGRPEPAKGTLIARQLYLLGKCMVGAVALEWRPAGSDEIDEVILWLPSDPQQTFWHYDSWQDLYDAIALRLRQPAFRRFFSVFVKVQDRASFDQALASLLKASAAGAAVQLDGRNLPIEGNLFAHVRAQQVMKIFDDARFIAVPTDQEGHLARQERLQSLLSAGLDLLTVASFFLPGLGAVLLVVNAVQVFDEIYEGYEDWQLGDRQGALDHVFGVAQSIVLAGVTGAALGVVRRVRFVDGLSPKVVSADKIKLVRTLEQLHVEENVTVLVQALHPELFADILSDDAQTLLAVTGCNPEQLRRLCVEQAAAPARLVDMHERIALHRAEPKLKGASFEVKLASLRPSPTADQALLIKAFKGLTPRAAEEIIQHTSSTQLDNLRSTGQLPLSMAERARWHLRDSRIDQACLGIRLQGMTNADSEILALKLIAQKTPWPGSSPVQLRSGSPEGALLYASEVAPAGAARVIVRNEQGYSLVAADGSLPAKVGEPLLQVVLKCLDDEQKAALGNRNLSAKQLRNALIDAAQADREQAARLIGLAPVGAGVRPPLRFADGRLAYTFSGGGESSHQAIRRGIHQIFPTLTELQLQAYLNAVRAQGVNLWDHYLSLQQQLADLRQALGDWQSQWRTPAEAIRRRRVAETLRRSWRRKLVDNNDEYELVLDGEHVGELPTLPAGVAYAHIRRLVLRNMGLQTVSEDFLRRFPNLVELDLSDNRLAQMPAGIETLTQLRRVNLSNNQIAIDAEANRRFAQLSLLESMELSFNPLLEAPDLSGLRHVRHLSLRGTHLADVSELLERASWRSLIDARENRIRELRQEVNGLSSRLARVSLHDNPLDSAGHQQLDGTRGGAVAGARGSSSYKHREASSAVRDLWTETRDVNLRREREASWDRLRQQTEAGDLFRFLADLSYTDDFQEHPGHFRRRVWRVLDACEHNEVLRDQIFRETGGMRSCEDRLLWILNQLETAVLVQQGINGVPAAVAEQSLVRLGRQLYRLDQVDAIAARHVQRMRVTAPGQVDEIEVRLIYRDRLAQALELPIQPDEMHYASFANVEEADLAKAMTEVLLAETPLGIQQTLADRPFWARFARQRYAERFEALAEPFHQRLAEYEVQAASGTEQAYLQHASELMQALESAEQQLLRTLAEEAWTRFPG